jgi:hypothetical protein
MAILLYNPLSIKHVPRGAAAHRGRVCETCERPIWTIASTRRNQKTGENTSGIGGPNDGAGGIAAVVGWVQLTTARVGRPVRRRDDDRPLNPASPERDAGYLLLATCLLAQRSFRRLARANAKLFSASALGGLRYALQWSANSWTSTLTRITSTPFSR